MYVRNNDHRPKPCTLNPALQKLAVALAFAAAVALGLGFRV